MPTLVTTGASNIYAGLFATGLIWLSLSLGRALLRWLGATGGSVAERGVIALGVGSGLLQFVPFGLGAIGKLDPFWVRAAFALLALALAREVVHVGRALLRTLRHPPRPSRWQLIWGLSLLPPLVVAALSALTPTLDPDGLSYHLTVPKRWLDAGGLVYLPTYHLSNAPMGGEMLFTVGLVFAGDAAAKLVHFTLGVAGAAGLYLAGKRLGGWIAGALAATSYLVSPFGVSGLLGAAYVEGLTAFALIASTLAWLVWFQDRSEGFLRSAALLAGFGVTFKMTAGLFPVALGGLTAAILWHESRAGTARGRLELGRVLVLALLVAAPVLPWLARSALVTGNPLFPMFAQWIPSRDYSPEAAAATERYTRYMIWASQRGADWSVERRQLTLLVAGLALCVPAGIAFWRMPTFRARACIVTLLCTTLVQLGLVGLYARYWVPTVAVLALPICVELVRYVPTGVATGALLAVSLLGSSRHTAGTLGNIGNDVAGSVRTVLGVDDQRSFLLKHLPLFPLYEHINQRLPESSRVLLSFYCGGFYVDRTTYCAEFVQDSLRMRDWNVFVEDVLRLKITHVVAPRTLATGGPRPPRDLGSLATVIHADEYREVGRLLRGHARLLASAADQGLYELDIAALRGSTSSGTP